MNSGREQNPLTEYYLQKLSWSNLYKLFLPLLLVVLLPLGYGLWRTLYGYSSFGPAAAARWGIDWFILSGTLLIPLLLYSLRRLQRSHNWLKIYPWGIEYHRPLRRKRKLTWEQIQGITTFSISRSFLGTGLFRSTKQHLILYSGVHAPYHCHPGLAGQAGLIKVIKKQVYQLLKPKLIRALKEGKTIPFGGVSISKEKMVLPKLEIPWEFLDGIAVQKGSFIIKLTAENAIEIPIRNLINLEILIHIIQTEI